MHFLNVLDGRTQKRASTKMHSKIGISKFNPKIIDAYIFEFKKDVLKNCLFGTRNKTRRKGKKSQNKTST